jgi:hypothetical protein
MDSEEEEGYDFDGLDLTTPITVTYDEDGFTLWDGWHRSAIRVVDSENAPAIIGVPNRSWTSRYL